MLYLECSGAGFHVGGVFSKCTGVLSCTGRSGRRRRYVVKKKKHELLLELSLSDSDV